MFQSILAEQEAATLASRTRRDFTEIWKTQAAHQKIGQAADHLDDQLNQLVRSLLQYNGAYALALVCAMVDAEEVASKAAKRSIGASLLKRLINNPMVAQLAKYGTMKLASELADASWIDWMEEEAAGLVIPYLTYAESIGLQPDWPQ